VAGILSDRIGARPFATGGMIGAGVGFGLLELLPVNFPYWLFAVLLFFTGLAMACFGSPNRAGVMNSLPPEHRGVGAGMNTTFMNSGQVLSIGIFFTLMIIGLSGSLPASLYHGLVSHGVPTASAHRISTLSPVSTLFASLLGYNPVQELLGPHMLSTLPHAQQVALTSRQFFPSLIAGPFKSGLHAALDFAIIASVLAAAASWTRGGKRPAAQTPLYGITPGTGHTDGHIDDDHVSEGAPDGDRVGAEQGRRVEPVREPAGASATGTVSTEAVR
jgi:MFS family permease